MHSLVTVLESLNHEIKDCSTLLYNLRHECIYNCVMYLQYFDGDINEFLYEMELYIDHRVYDKGFCNIVPVIMANVLKVPIIIIDKMYTFYQVFVNYPPDEKYCIEVSFTNSDLSNFIILCRFIYHYDVYVKLQSSVSHPNENILSDRIIYRDEKTDKLSDISVLFCVHDNFHANACFVIDGDDTHDMLNESCNDYLYHMRGCRIKNARNCSIGYLNVNSIRKKFDAIECILNGGLADIFAWWELYDLLSTCALTYLTGAI